MNNSNLLDTGQGDLERRLLSETFLRGVEIHNEIDSTNSRALQLQTASDQRPYLIWAHQQTSGRGRGRNNWWASGGSLTFTLLLDPDGFDIPRSQWPALSLSVGTAICQQLMGMQVDNVRLKWPNDVYVDSRKIAGVLIESIPAHPGVLAIGIGLNVNNSLAQAPAALSGTATSLVDQLGLELSLADVLVSLLQELDQVLQLLGRSPESLPQLWRSLCMLTSRQITVRDVQQTTTGIVHGIDDDGALQLRTATGLKRVFSGTIEIEPEST
ncbi:MAG: biotin--[acetyl-CoA-carboxylase] ligase [Planctomycetaceae bacterium]|nr:biotin--[acetyl-CoA-carboxylase] ligase [Planctomycetaceae bacterium]